MGAEVVPTGAAGAMDDEDDDDEDDIGISAGVDMDVAGAATFAVGGVLEPLEGGG